MDEIKKLLKQWQEFQPLKEEDADKLWRKIRLDWNYHSNKIEGNTLTYGETELLFLHDKTPPNRPYRDLIEMKAHDVAIKWIKKISGEERFISEADIRDINKIILKEEFEKEAITLDGEPTRVKIIPGIYKVRQNNVKTATGETFYFASPEETPQKMQDFYQWFKEEMDSSTNSLNIVDFITKLHYDFIIIHPFGDGNGRTCRILINYALMKKGYLPITINAKRRSDYINVLQQADVENFQPLKDFIKSNIINALELGIKAAQGEDITELEDIDQEIEYLAKQTIKLNQTEIDEKINIFREKTIKPMFEMINSRLNKWGK